MANELPELLVPDAAAWRAWLADNHASSPGVWLVLTKKGGQVTALDYPAALDEALCYGWIDGQVARRDEGSTRQRFTPRRSRSAWSKRNVEHIARLSAEGRIMPAGQAAVDAAKADGRWEAAYAGAAAAEVPPDLAEALAGNQQAQAMWDVLTSQNRYAITYRVGQLKRPETRARRIAEFVAMLERGETLHPQKRQRP
ncbi:YdeI/OmpD-associated family protein [Jatrophihabitans sp.]|uniref:YdeI/OmpD-associated family protein n=1 Tax=Jatrophihabitans sp. TaxID=1932789 RepID=UPI002CF8BA82|nr:YdeI/OmpD-associated family protein [Jatrophihabitans sp.]